MLLYSIGGRDNKHDFKYKATAVTVSGSCKSIDRSFLIVNRFPAAKEMLHFIQYPPIPPQRKVLHLVESCLHTLRKLKNNLTPCPLYRHHSLVNDITSW